MTSSSGEASCDARCARPDWSLLAWGLTACQEEMRWETWAEGSLVTRLAHTCPPPLGHPAGPDILPLQGLLVLWQSSKQSSGHKVVFQVVPDEGLSVDEEGEDL